MTDASMAKQTGGARIEEISTGRSGFVELHKTVPKSRML
jgi:hypothetical protein